MSVYAYVENGIIQEIYYIKPRSWKNISNFHVINDEDLKNYNWYPVVDETIEYDPELKEVVDFEYRFDQNQVKRIYLLVDKQLPQVETTSTEESSII